MAHAYSADLWIAAHGAALAVIEGGASDPTIKIRDSGDVLLAISTSGNSANVLHAARVAHAKGVKVISLTGKTGGKLKALSDSCICAPTDITFEIQEYHLPIYHCLCACVENELFGDAQ